MVDVTTETLIFHAVQAQAVPQRQVFVDIHYDVLVLVIYDYLSMLLVMLLVLPLLSTHFSFSFFSFFSYPFSVSSFFSFYHDVLFQIHSHDHSVYHHHSNQVVHVIHSDPFHSDRGPFVYRYLSVSEMMVDVTTETLIFHAVQAQAVPQRQVFVDIHYDVLVLVIYDYLSMLLVRLLVLPLLSTHFSFSFFFFIMMFFFKFILMITRYIIIIQIK